MNVVVPLVRDVAGLAAIASISYGAWLTFPPAGFIVGGLILLAGVYVWSRGTN
jgi:hypothetical protein